MKLKFLRAFLVLIALNCSIVFLWATPIFTTTTQNVNCFGQNEGKILVNVTSSNGACTYSIDGTTFTTSNVFQNLAAGNYTVTVKDSDPTPAMAAVTITQPTELIINSTSTTKSVCKNGSIEISATGGTTTYQYSIDNFAKSQSSNLFTNLDAGYYTAYVKDANGCVASTPVNSINVEDNKMQVIVNPIPTNVSCKGLADGSAIFTIKGGEKNTTGPEYYVTVYRQGIVISTATISLIDNAGNTQVTIGALQSGMHQILIQDKNGCELSVSFEILDGAELLSAINSVTNLTCYGANNAAFEFTTIGGQLNYTVECTDPTFTGTIITAGAKTTVSDLAAGNYELTVTDANGCTQLTNVYQTITQPANAITYAPNSIDAQCNAQPSGKIFGNATGGTAPYLYTITNTTNPYTEYNTSGLFENLPVGNYTATVRDKNNCEVTATDLIIKEPEALTVEPLTENPAATVVCDFHKTASVSFTIVGRTDTVAASDTATFYSATLYNITTQTEVIAPELVFSNKMHALKFRQYVVIDTIVDPITDDTTFVNRTIKDTLWDEGCHEPTKEWVIGPTYTIDKKGFDCNDQLTISGLGKATYRAKIFKGACQIGLAEFTVGSTGTAPIVNLDGTTVFCDSVELTLTPTITAVPGIRAYKWFLDGDQVATTSTFTHRYLNEDNGKSLKVEVTNACGTAMSNNIPVSIIKRPKVLVKSDDNVLCENEPGKLAYEFSGIAPFTYVYSDESGQQVSNEVVVVRDITPTVDTQYSLTELKDANCTSFVDVDVTPFDVTITPEPSIALTVDVPDPMVSGRYVTATATAGHADYKLEVNGNAIPATTEVNVFKTKDFRYGTTMNLFDLEVTDTDGCVWNVSEMVEVNSTVFPNVFTPNGDGINDIFLNGYNLNVFDRWGATVYQGKEGWDGTFNGKPVNVGVYLYTVEIEDQAGEIAVIKSTVTVER